MVKQLFLIVFLFSINLQAVSWKQLGTGVAALFTGYIAQQKVVKAESLFYKEDGKPLSAEEHDFVYEVMLKNQFPTCLNYQKEYNHNEISTMQRIIQRKFPDIKVGFIPTAAYELFFLSNLNDEYKNNIVKSVLGEKGPLQLEIDSLLEARDDNDDFNDQSLNYEKINGYCKSIHALVNTHIVGSLPKKPHDMNADDYCTIINNDNIRSHIKDQLIVSSIYINDNFVAKYIIPLVQAAIVAEYEAYKKGNFLLYRGVKDITTDITEDTKKASLSFGNSLFAGIKHDVGACAVSHIYTKQFGYRLSINKLEYSQKDNIYSLFYIPKLSTIAGLMGRGELFHARSKVPAQSDKKVLGFWGIVSPVIFITKNDPQQIYSSIFRYIKEKHIPFKFDDATLKT